MNVVRISSLIVVTLAGLCACHQNTASTSPTAPAMSPDGTWSKAAGPTSQVDEFEFSPRRPAIAAVGYSVVTADAVRHISF